MRRTAAILLALTTIAGSAHALTVSGNVGPLVMAAQSFAQAGNYKAAMGKLDEADAIKASPDDANVIYQIRQYAASCIAGANRQCAPTQP